MLNMTRRNLGLASGMAAAVALSAAALIAFSAEASPASRCVTAIVRVSDVRRHTSTGTVATDWMERQLERTAVKALQATHATLTTSRVAARGFPTRRTRQATAQ